MTNFDSLFPDNRLSGDTPLRQAQFVMLRLLKIFDFICKKHSLSYWLDAGTLLGAVRHGGFIPWDDDIDVLMPLDDYQTFCSIVRSELPKDVFYQSETTDTDYVCPWIKLRDCYSFMNETTGPYPYSQAIFIDIFPAVFITKRQMRWRSLFILLPPYNKKPERIVPHLAFKSKLKRTVQAAYQNLFIAISKVPIIQNTLNTYFTTGEKKWAYEPPIRYLNTFSNDIIFPLTTIKFEDAEFSAPANYHQYLTDYFGDYMQLPPKEKQKSEHNVDQIFPIGPNPHFSALQWDKK